MTSASIFEFFRCQVAVKNIPANIRYSVSWMAFIFSLLDSNQSTLNKNAKTVAGVSTRQISVVCNVSGAKSQIFVQYAENRQVGGLHPVHLPMHKCPVKSESLYMTGLYCSSHGFELHTLRYREVDISSWGSDNVIDYELVATQRTLGKRVDACHQQAASSWSQNRMYHNALSRFKITGATAAQTPSKRPHRDPGQGSTVQGAGVTATNQSPHGMQEVDGSD